MRVHHRARAALAAAVALVALFALAGSASAYTPGPGFAASDYATNFPASGVGPVGIGFAGTDFLAVDSANGDVYRFPPAGGDAATHVLRAGAYPGSAGLSVLNGHAYLALWSSGFGLAVLDPVTGNEISRVLTGQRFLSLAINPVDGKLYANTFGDRVYRLDGLETATPSATPYVSSVQGGSSFDGIAFGPDGTLFGSAQNGGVWKIPPGPGGPVQVATVPTGDGIAYAPGDSITAPFIAVNANNGTITKVDLTSGATSPMLTGGSRGDFVAVGPDKCLYATQTDRVIKVTKADGTCQFVPPPPPAADRLVADPILLHILPGLKVNLAGLRATLLGGSPEHGIAGKKITFTGGGRTLCTATTDANGVAECGNALTNVAAVLGLRYTASFAGDASWRPASGVGKIALIGSLGLL